VVIELERCAGGQCKVISVPHPGGTVHKPADILEAIERGAQ
jgi:2-oxoglutarate ferredoxin oxidoreductase subunit alpha